MSRVEIGLKIDKRAGWKKASRGGKMLKINKRACSLIGYLRVGDLNLVSLGQIYHNEISA